MATVDTRTLRERIDDALANNRSLLSLVLKIIEVSPTPLSKGRIRAQLSMHGWRPALHWDDDRETQVQDSYISYDDLSVVLEKLAYAGYIRPAGYAANGAAWQSVSNDGK